MVGLGIELRCKALYLFARDLLIGTLEAHAENEIIEPLNHDPAPLSYATEFTASLESRRRAI
jgi:hypothetical protein